MHPWVESGTCLFVCEREKTINSFENIFIIFKAYEKCKSPVTLYFLHFTFTLKNEISIYRISSKISRGEIDIFHPVFKWVYLRGLFKNES